MQLFLRLLSRPQAHKDAIKLQPVGENYLALPDEDDEDENDNNDDGQEEQDGNEGGQAPLTKANGHLPRWSPSSSGGRSRLPFWLIVTPQHTSSPTVQIRFQQGALSSEQAGAILAHAEDSIAQLVRRVNQELLLWYASDLSAPYLFLIFLPIRSLHKTSHCSTLLVPPAEGEEKLARHTSPWQDSFVLHLGKEVALPPPFPLSSSHSSSRAFSWTASQSGLL